MVDPSRVFVSYARTDGEFVLRVCQDLRGAGASIWLDKLDIRPGEEWDEAIQRGLAECGRMLVVLSPKSVASDNVLDEVGYALSKKKRILPVLYQDCEVPYRLNRIQFVDFRTSYDTGLQDLLSEIRNPTGAAEPIPPSTPKGWGRRWYVMAGAAAVALGLGWATLDPGGKAPTGNAGPAVAQLSPKRAEEVKPPDPLPIDKPTRTEVVPTQPAVGRASNAPFSRDSFRKALMRYVSEAPSGFQKLGAQEFVDWRPSVKLPGARSCRGSGYPGEPVIECVVYRTDSEVEATNKFEDLMELTQAVLPGWEGGRVNLFNAVFSSDKSSSLVILGVSKGNQFDVQLSVRPKR